MLSWIKNAMSGAASFLGGSFPWAAAGIVAALGGVILYGLHLARRDAVLETQVVVMARQHEADLQSLNDVRRQADRNARILTEEANDSSRRAAQTQKLLDDIRHASQRQNGAVAPVLAHALDGLRGGSAAVRP